MPNPKAPRVRRRPAPEPTGPMLPVRRMRRVGADETLVDYWREVWDHLPETERDALRASWRRLDDAALAHELGVEHSVEEFPDPSDAAAKVEPVDHDALLGVPEGAPEPASDEPGPEAPDETPAPESGDGEPAGETIEGTLGVTLDEVPRGTVDDVLGWVRSAEDADLRRARARAALDVEGERTDAEGNPKPRVGVTDALREVAGA